MDFRVVNGFGVGWSFIKGDRVADGGSTWSRRVLDYTNHLQKQCRASLSKQPGPWPSADACNLPPRRGDHGRNAALSAGRPVRQLAAFLHIYYHSLQIYEYSR